MTLENSDTPYRSNAHKPVKVTFRQRWHSTEGKQYLLESYTFSTPEEAAAFVLGLRHIQDWDPDPRIEVDS